MVVGVVVDDRGTHSRRWSQWCDMVVVCGRSDDGGEIYPLDSMNLTCCRTH